MLSELHVIVEPFFAEVAGKGLVLLECVSVDDVDVEVLLHLETLAAVLAQVVVERRVNVAVMLLLGTKINSLVLFKLTFFCSIIVGACFYL